MCGGKFDRSIRYVIFMMFISYMTSVVILKEGYRHIMPVPLILYLRTYVSVTPFGTPFFSRRWDANKPISGAVIAYPDVEIT